MVGNELVTLLGCDRCENGEGLIRVYATKDWTLLGQIKGRQPTLQNDTGIPSTTRIWYIKNNSDVEAALVYLERSTLVLEPHYLKSETVERSFGSL